MPNNQLAFIVRDVSARIPMGLRILANTRCRVINCQPNNTSTVELYVEGECKSAVVVNDAIAIDTMDCVSIAQKGLDDGQEKEF